MALPALPRSIEPCKTPRQRKIEDFDDFLSEPAGRFGLLRRHEKVLEDLRSAKQVNEANWPEASKGRFSAAKSFQLAQLIGCFSLRALCARRSWSFFNPE